jgi:Fic family protein
MSRITGTYAITTTQGEPVKAFIPHGLPPAEPALDAAVWARLNEEALTALQRLSAVAGLVPSVEWLLYSAIRKEALLTSQIEGTQATLIDLFDEEAGLAISNTDDVEEVTNYLQAFNWAQEQLRSDTGLPISVRMLSEAHRLLLNGVRGTGKQPGELRRSQNLPVLVRIALVHAQFETIHPYLDGNGRIGRLLIAILLEHWQLLPEPLMYISGFLKQHQSEYYRRLSCIRTEGDWEAWVQFFLEAVQSAAHQSETAVVAVASLVTNDRKRLLAHPKANAISYRLFEMLPTMPRFTVDRVCKILETTFPTASAAIKLLEELGMVKELSGLKKNRTYSYAAYIDLLSQ